MRLLLSLIFTLCALGSRAQSTLPNFSVKGFLPYWKGANVTLRIDGKQVHALLLEKDVYSYSGYTNRAQPGTIEIRENAKGYSLPFFIEPGVIKIRDKGSKRLEVYGTPVNDSFWAINHRFDSLVLSGPHKPNGAVMVTKKSLASDYIRSNPHSIISLQLLHDYFFLHNSVDDTTYATLFRVLDPVLQQTALGMKIAKEVEQSQRTAPGADAIQLFLPDSSRTLLPLYKKGEYTLIHFWASWCVPCKKEFPQLSAIHRRFAPLGFSLTGVSMDRNVVAWKKVAQKLPGKQLIDPRSWEGASATSYGIKLVPMNVLLNPQGTIIAKNLSMADLEKKLSELLTPQTF
jgi:thiol-disulfide isomerase/thioredoxin